MAAVYIIVAFVGIVWLRKYMKTMRPGAYAAVRETEVGCLASPLRGRATEAVLDVWHTWRGYSRQRGGGQLDTVLEEQSDGSCSPPEHVSVGSPGAWVALTPGRSLACGGEEVYTDPPSASSQAGRGPQCTQLNTHEPLQPLPGIRAL